MKKMLNLFNKKKRFSVTSDRFDSDAVPEAPRNLPQYSPATSELYKNFNNDDCFIGTNLQSTNESNMQNNERSDTSQESGVVTVCGGRDHEASADPAHVDMQSLTCSMPCESDSSQIVSSEDVSINTCNSSVHSVSSENINRAVNRFIGNSNSNNDNASLEDCNSNNVSNIPKAFGKDKKTGGNTYVITISNSAHFHIGPQKTVNYPQFSDGSLTKKDLELSEKCKKISLIGRNNFNDNCALDLKETLSEDDVLQISLCVEEKWRELARNLGVDETVMNELEILNDKDYNLIVFDILQEYLSRYPGTTVGYIISVLKKSGETRAIQKLLERR